MRHVLIATALVLASAPAQAQGKKAFAMESSGSSDRTFLASYTVLNVNPSEMTAHFELNLGGLGAIALEGGVQGRYQHFSDKTVLETGESLESEAKGIALLVARYTDGPTMSGFFWALGLGYRQVDAKWAVKPEANDPDLGENVDMSLLDTSERLNHAGTIKGNTGHFRVGYRYTANEWPILIGAYLGVRHFAGTVADTQPDSQVQDEGDGSQQSVTYSNMTDREAERLRRRFMTKSESGLEIGVVF